MTARAAAIVWMIVSLSLTAGAESVTISGPAAVDDAALLDGEFAGWNFGGSPLLEAGLMGGIYAEHRGASMIRFARRSLNGAKVTAATLRLYKPTRGAGITNDKPECASATNRSTGVPPVHGRDGHAVEA